MAQIPTHGVTGWYWRSERNTKIVLAATFALSYAGVWIAWAVTGLGGAPWYACFIIGLWPWILSNLLLSVYHVSKI